MLKFRMPVLYEGTSFREALGRAVGTSIHVPLSPSGPAAWQIGDFKVRYRGHSQGSGTSHYLVEPLTPEAELWFMSSFPEAEIIS